MVDLIAQATQPNDIRYIAWIPAQDLIGGAIGSAIYCFFVFGIRMRRSADTTNPATPLEVFMRAVFSFLIGEGVAALATGPIINWGGFVNADRAFAAGCLGFFAIFVIEVCYAIGEKLSANPGTIFGWLFGGKKPPEIPDA